MTATHYYVYILQCENGSYYTGYTTNLTRRYQEHQNGTTKCKYTRSFKPVKIAQSWSAFDNKTEALAIERFIKRLSKPAKSDLILNPDHLTTLFQCQPFNEAITMNPLILATSNPGKIVELQAMLPSFQCISQQSLHIEDAEENGLSFIENAIIKARHASRIGQQPALADDSGLVVDALNGEPGIYSARFAGLTANNNDNINLLLKRLADVPHEQRHAYFYCAIAFVKHENDPTPLIATGELLGQITRARQGDYGFGYDPVFYLPDYQCTLAELPLKLKNTISHRAMALKQLHGLIQ